MFLILSIVSLQCTLDSSEFVLQHILYTVREEPDTVDEGHRKKLLKFHLANFLHVSTNILGPLALIYAVLLYH
jgi:ABC-type multidrug transport system permease subunit